ncbi:hypothetical protein DMJ13_21185 [halophilic archaeon]|nr:hypothetical protein DMJ13_21185 [halophilic archaeon]
MSDSKDELRQRFNQTRQEDHEETTDNQENPDNSSHPGGTGDVDDSGNTGDGYDWSDKYNYPFYVPREFANELDQIYNQYDAKNKLEGGDGLEKHREVLFPIMEAAIEELDLDEIVDWETEDSD